MSEAEGASADLERLLAYLKSARGFDFTSYKPTTLSRRIEKRMQTVGVATYGEYEDYLEVHQDEFPQLFNTVLINVTSFFRDPEAWAYMRDFAVPALLAAKGPKDPIRVWVAACASGEEACSIAMLLVGAMGEAAFRERVKIYATDLDDEALACSRAASYSEADLEAVDPTLRERFFERVDDRYVFDREVRRSVIYGRHNLLQDAPISRIDLLTCRNTLIYFNSEAQDRILQRFHFALAEGGYLFLGRAETMLTHSDLFAPIDARHRVFAKVPRARVRDRGFMFTVHPGDSQRMEGDLARLRDAAFEAGPHAQLLLNAAGLLISANERARSYFGISRADFGVPIQDLDVSFRPVELRSGIEQAHGQRRAVGHRHVAWTVPSGERNVFDVTISPLRNDKGDILGTNVAFEDVSLNHKLQNEVQSFRQELETAYEEVQSTNEELQTTNEELQSTVEELQTTNEELQSTNEELETTNEELQSANEELETMNEELRSRSGELNQSNAFLASVLSGLRDGVIVLDADLQILAWNGQSEDLWGLRADEVLGKHLLNLDIGLPLDEMRTHVRACLATGEPQTAALEAMSRRGRKLDCTVTFTPLRGNAVGGRGVTILMTCATSG